LHYIANLLIRPRTTRTFRLTRIGTAEVIGDEGRFATSAGEPADSLGDRPQPRRKECGSEISSELTRRQDLTFRQIPVLDHGINLGTLIGIHS
jgi:hypothetical protein